MQRVDPFVPVPAAPPRMPKPTHSLHPQKESSAHPHPHPPIPRQFAAPKQTARSRSKQNNSRPRRHVWSNLSQAGFILGAIGLGFLVRSPTIGQVAILVYAVACIIYKIESRTSYILAFMSLVVVIISSLRSDTVLASAFAIYTFLLLVIGTISLAREARSNL